MVSKSDFDRVQKYLRTRRVATDESGSQRTSTVLVRCTSCGLHMVVVRTASGHRYYRCRTAMMGDVRNAACRGVVRMLD